VATGLWQTGAVPESRVDALRAAIENLTGKTAPSDPDESLFESGVLDSFVLVDLVAALEEAYKVKIPDSDVSPRKFDSLARIDAYLSQL
jgi:acyl carrier protein